jgi:hypothetical protein
MSYNLTSGANYTKAVFSILDNGQWLGKLNLTAECKSQTRPWRVISGDKVNRLPEVFKTFGPTITAYCVQTALSMPCVANRL